MQLNKLPKMSGKQAKRLGRGLGSGRGKTAGRGTKGQKSRSGHNIPRRFEGGQMPLIQRLPKMRGFRSLQKKFQIVKVSQIEKSFKTGEIVSQKSLAEKGLIETSSPVKILRDAKPKVNCQFRDVKLTQKLLAEYSALKKPTSKKSE